MNINNKNLCPNCFLETNEATCPECSYNAGSPNPVPTALPLGTILLGRYIIGRTLGKGGFGVTYLAYDSVESKKVAVKEYMPDTLTHRNSGDTAVSTFRGDKEDAFKKGAEKFFEEAQMVSRFNGNPGLIWVYKFFYENNTAYFIMEFLEGTDLKAHIIKNGVLGERQLLDIIAPLIDSLIVVHSIDVLHRDISPDNIYLTKDGNIKLLDFGAARQVIGEASQSLSIILKQGFAPIEQYQTKGKQGAWTDIYALGATMYYCLTGAVPIAPMDRLEEDTLVIPENISDNLRIVLQKMLAVRAVQRYQSVIDLKQDMKNYGLIGGVALDSASAQREAPVPVNPVTPAAPPIIIEMPKKKKTSVIAAVAAVISLVVVLGIGGIIWAVSNNNNDEDYIPVVRDDSPAATTSPPRITASSPPPEITTSPPTITTTTTTPPMTTTTTSPPVTTTTTAPTVTTTTTAPTVTTTTTSPTVTTTTTAPTVTTTTTPPATTTTTRPPVTTTPAPEPTVNVFVRSTEALTWITTTRTTPADYSTAGLTSGEWYFLESPRFRVNDRAIKYCSAAFEVSYVRDGTAYVKDLIITEYDNNGNSKVIYDYSSDRNRRGFILHSDLGTGRLLLSGDELQVTGTTGPAVVNKVYLEVKQGHSYQASGRVRYVNNGNAVCSAVVAPVLDFFG
jgi:serine/threonine protein kinase